jgi:hypothetical protein
VKLRLAIHANQFLDDNFRNRFAHPIHEAAKVKCFAEIFQPVLPILAPDVSNSLMGAFHELSSLMSNPSFTNTWS